MHPLNGNVQIKQGLGVSIIITSLVPDPTIGNGHPLPSKGPFDGRGWPFLRRFFLKGNAGGMELGWPLPALDLSQEAVAETESWRAPQSLDTRCQTRARIPDILYPDVSGVSASVSGENIAFVGGNGSLFQCRGSLPAVGL